MTETPEQAPLTLHQSNLSDNSSVGDIGAPPRLPVELWHAICHLLQLDVEAEVAEMLRPTSHSALRCLGQTSRFLHQLTLSVRTGVIYIWARNGRIDVEGQPGSGRNAVKLALLRGYWTPVMEAMQSIPGPSRLIFYDYEFCEQNVLDWVIATPTVTSLTLSRCSVIAGAFSVAPNLTTEELYFLVDLRKSNVKTLNLSYPYSGDPNYSSPPALALLALIPSLMTLIITPVSLRRIGQLPTTLDLPPLRSLTVVSHLTASINQTHILSFLWRCPTLETLHISSPILSKVLEPGEKPANMPNLKEYDARPEYLTLIHAPALRRVVVRSLQWNGADALIRSLASMASDLETVVLELTARMDDPAINSIEQWVEEAAGRWSPHWEPERFSLVIRTAPLGEWIYSAKVGRAEPGEIFFDYCSRREESMAYLATSAN